MGYEIAKAAANKGAEVVLISGPSHQKADHSLIKIISVISAEEMYNASHKYFDDVDVAVLSAAVSDFRPKKPSSKKIKNLTIL